MTGAKQRVIVNADDLGLSERVNDAIFAAMDAGCVTSATMIANGDAFEAAAARARRYPQCSFGVHLNLTQFKPLSANKGLGALVSSDGAFSPAWRARPFRLSQLAAAFDEFSAQIERVRASLGSVSHVDSHHHVHTIPALFPALARVVRKFGIRRARLSRNWFGPGETIPSSLVFKKSLWNAALRYGVGVRTTDYFADLTSFAETSPPRDCLVELMVHPGHEGYAAENAILAREWWKSRPAGISFVTYNDV